MLLYEPPPTQADLHFRLFGVPVRVHPFFWVVTALMGLNTTTGTPPSDFITWVGVVFVSILVHEMGHAALQRRFGGRPWIVLHGLGGLAICDDCDRRPSSQILISLAGPFAGFCFAGLVVAALAAMGRLEGFELDLIPVRWELFDLQYAEANMRYGPVDRLVVDLLYVNIVWGLVNLLPVYPLDGGRVMREICTLRDARRGIVLSLQISVVTAGAMALYGLFAWQSIFTAMMFGYLAFTSFQTIAALRAHGY
jgi:stage IV sporulation protein FB